MSNQVSETFYYDTCVFERFTCSATFSSFFIYDKHIVFTYTGETDDEISEPTPFTCKRKAIKRKVQSEAVNGSHDTTNKVLSSMSKASECLQELVNVKSQDTKTSKLPDDITGFLMTLGTDLSDISDSRSRRKLMIEIQSLVLAQMSQSPSGKAPNAAASMQNAMHGWGDGRPPSAPPSFMGALEEKTYYNL